MSNNVRLTGLAAILSLSLACGCLSAAVLPVVIPATSEIYSSGQAATSQGGTLPPSFSFTAGGGQTISFSSVTGTVSCGGMCASGIAPDGASIAGMTGTNIG